MAYTDRKAPGYKDATDADTPKPAGAPSELAGGGTGWTGRSQSLPALTHPDGNVVTGRKRKTADKTGYGQRGPKVG